MWKKFCVAILSICLMSGAAMAGGALFAAGTSTLQIIDQENQQHYINEEFSFTLSSSSAKEQVLFIEGGTIYGNGDTIQIPLLEDQDTVTIKGIKKPGSYHGEIKAQVANLDGSEPKEMIGNAVFTIYGKAFQNESSELNVKDQKQLQVIGELPPSLEHGLVRYSSDQDEIASVNQDGVVTANKEGTATITVSVYDGIQDEAHCVSQSDMKLHVNGRQDREISFDTAISGKDAGYRFYQSEQVIANQSGEQKIGLIDCGQSGEHTYYVEEKQEKNYEIRDGYVYTKKQEAAGMQEVIVYALHKDINQLYRVKASYESTKKAENQDSSFVFRYEGNPVTSIVRTYAEGRNAFQITSSKSVEDVIFRLKHEADQEYLTVSQTGNVTIKKVTDEPILMEATWHKMTYELPIIIQKADQRIAIPLSEVQVSVEDGSFDPLITGRNGTGALVGNASRDYLDLKLHDDGTLSLLPLKAGTTRVELYNNGDENYKKSNVLTLTVHISETTDAEIKEEGDMSAFLIEGVKGRQDWYTEPVTLSLPPTSPYASFQIQKNWYLRCLKTGSTPCRFH